MNKTYCFDLDGTLCTLTDGMYEKAQPIIDRIQKVNKLYDEKNTIIINTARGFVTNINWEEVTKKQLSDWNVKYNYLYFNKPAADFYIDDKALEIENWLGDKF
tara:strand:+ start:563 stop:871 length:309 start_codon:yes stop_codon:yes gene_type:complete